MNKIQDMKARLKKRATLFALGDVTLANSSNGNFLEETVKAIKKLFGITEAPLTVVDAVSPELAHKSWVGRVFLYKADEEIPLDHMEKPMIPLIQICFDGLPYIPESLSETKFLTVFVSKSFPGYLAENGDNWFIREYKAGDALLVKELDGGNSRLKPFTLSASLVEEDFPMWQDDDALSDELREEIDKMWDTPDGDDYYDNFENVGGHKIGGYPSYCQGGTSFGEGFEFVMQIASDDKARLNIVDGGTIFLAKNPATGAWRYYCDFH